MFVYSRLLQDHRSLWTTPLISLSKMSFNSKNQDPMRKASIDLLLYLPMPVFSLPISISTVLRFTIGVLAVTLRTHPSAMASASGSWQDAAPLPSTSRSRAISSFATVRCPQMHPSATVLIRRCLDGLPTTTEVSGAWQVLPPSGAASHTGCSPSTSEQQQRRLPKPANN